MLCGQIENLAAKLRSLIRHSPERIRNDITQDVDCCGARLMISMISVILCGGKSSLIALNRSGEIS